MDSDVILPLIMALSVGVGFLITLIARKKGGSQKEQEFLFHLQGIGIKATPFNMESEEAKLLGKRSWGDKAETILTVQDKNMDAIVIIGVSSQYGTNYYIEYIVKNTKGAIRPDAKKTGMQVKKSPPLFGKAVNIEWKGDANLAQRLNFDFSLKYKLLNEGLNSLKGGIQIIPEPKKGYSRIKTGYEPPSPELFDVINGIAKHVKSWA